MFCYILISLDLPSATEIGDGAFMYCESLISLDLPSATEIGAWAIRNCKNLISVRLPNIVKIGENALTGCTKLESITLSENLKEMENCGVNSCNNIRSVYYPAKDPLEFRMPFLYTFSYDTLDYGTLYVPEEAIEKCKTLFPWRHFKSIQPYDFSRVDSVTADETGKSSTEVYTTSGVKVSQSIDDLPHGIYIVRQGNHKKKVIIN